MIRLLENLNYLRGSHPRCISRGLCWNRTCPQYDKSVEPLKADEVNRWKKVHERRTQDKNGTIQGQDVKFGRCVVSRERASVVGAIKSTVRKGFLWGIPCSENCKDLSSKAPCT